MRPARRYRRGRALLGGACVLGAQALLLAHCGGEDTSAAAALRPGLDDDAQGIPPDGGSEYALPEYPRAITPCRVLATQEVGSGSAGAARRSALHALGAGYAFVYFEGSQGLIHSTSFDLLGHTALTEPLVHPPAGTEPSHLNLYLQDEQLHVAYSVLRPHLRRVVRHLAFQREDAEEVASLSGHAQQLHVTSAYGDRQPLFAWQQMPVSGTGAFVVFDQGQQPTSYETLTDETHTLALPQWVASADGEPDAPNLSFVQLGADGEVTLKVRAFDGSATEGELTVEDGIQHLEGTPTAVAFFRGELGTLHVWAERNEARTVLRAKHVDPKGLSPFGLRSIGSARGRVTLSQPRLLAFGQAVLLFYVARQVLEDGATLYSVRQQMLHAWGEPLDRHDEVILATSNEPIMHLTVAKGPQVGWAALAFDTFQTEDERRQPVFVALSCSETAN